MKRLWLPRSAQPDEETRVRRCLTCGTDFPWNQTSQWARHVVRCAERNEEVIEAHIEATEASPLTSISDKEAFAWIRKRAAQGKKSSKGGLPA